MTEMEKSMSSRILYCGVTIPKRITNTVIYPRIEERSSIVENKNTKKRAFSSASSSSCEPTVTRR